MAGFTGLCLTKGLSSRPFAQRKATIALSAIAMGGGIWSMHFVAMLGLQLPIQFYYNFLITLISALVAILVIGCALLILHFRPRTKANLNLAGFIVGIGIIAMHYIGMSALEMCRTVYTPAGIFLAILTSCSLSIGAFRVAYDKRTSRNTILGTLGFAISVFLVHFIAMASTRFEALEATVAPNQMLGNQALAVAVVLSSFALCASFLLTGVTFSPDPATDEAPSDPTLPNSDPAVDPTRAMPVNMRQVPYEKNGKTLFIDQNSVSAVRAEGHYTFLYTETEKLFCTWSISEASKRLLGYHFIKCHRSFLINPTHVTSFERTKDNGICYFNDTRLLDSVPVSRSCMKAVRTALGV